MVNLFTSEYVWLVIPISLVIMNAALGGVLLVLSIKDRLNERDKRGR